MAKGVSEKAIDAMKQERPQLCYLLRNFTQLGGGERLEGPQDKACRAVMCVRTTDRIVEDDAKLD